MIQLFATPEIKINPEYYNHLLHGNIVRTFEKEFAEYVGAEYACSFNSATNAIQILLETRQEKVILLPSMLPLVVGNAVLLSGHGIQFVDNTAWVGHSYRLTENIVDSAQKVERNQFLNSPNTLAMVFSFYPTKPVGGCDGGMIVSNDKNFIEYLRKMSMNGCSNQVNSWGRKQEYIGYKAYMNSIQAEIALGSLRKLDEKKQKLAEVRSQYNSILNLNNTSDHLYRVNVFNNDYIVGLAADHGVCLGIHYQALHKTKVFKQDVLLPNTETEELTIVSLPFHEQLTKTEIEYVCNFIKENNRI